ncbi:MAG: hypothetical protein KJ871_04460 [Alphaproteobacteria bacterium]|nr:hypothetical protein [Alphaproteobacteria bacterium]MBU2083940.1 hypothetical protein [Alphaproteobacteria bacterium]MBU2142292.1 hypothetical protein [Alphaproteobacteria bacterium]MBU2196490.1 hypothetical protein [Alphaproteobacteria bacterium]
MAKRSRKASKPAAKAETFGVSIRMYRLGVGDCFLLRFQRGEDGEPPYSILIDCGIHQSAKGGSDLIRRVVQDIADVTSKKLDLLVGTHEHWDHISGFSQAEDIFSTMVAKKAWLAWTENDADELAQKIALKEKRYQALALLSAADNRLRLSGAGPDPKLESLMGFFGPGGGVKLKKAGDNFKSLAGDEIEFLKPGGHPIELPGIAARVYVLGPPRNEKLIAKNAPSRSTSEVYEFGHFAAAADRLEKATHQGNAPFDSRFAIPMKASSGIDFFSRHYWGDFTPDASDCGVEEPRQDWRRADNAWSQLAESLALNLDEDTNNTSLVLAFELGDTPGEGPILLFAADAQVGNWLGWKDLTFQAGAKTVTSRDLLARTIVYKVAHHASHNATLREEGLELMDALELALVPTDDAMAAKVKWGTLPWPALLERLDEKASAGVVRTDRSSAPSRGRFRVTKSDLFFEFYL